MNIEKNNIYKRYNQSTYSKNSAINSNNPSFGGKNLEYTQQEIKKIAKSVDSILGKDNFFTAKLQSAGIDTSKATIVIKDEGLLKSIAKTIKYPFLDMPLDIANWALSKAQNTPLKGIADKLSKNSVLQKRAQTAQKEKSYGLLQDLLGQYFPSGKDFGTLDIEKSSENFKKNVTSGINKTIKNYDSRDERTLNRMATSTVSAVYSGMDFYNISMLQKDDKGEAKKAQKSRFKQEMTRMAFSAGLTFLTLGALNKYVKTNIVANSLVIALSALISEVGSRILSHTPLHPLSAKEAESIAKKRHITPTNSSNDNKQDNKISFTNNEQKVIFKDFTQQDGNFASVNLITSNMTANAPKKSGTLLRNTLILSAACSAGYLLSKGAKGEYAAKIAKRKLFNANSSEISNYINKKSASLKPDITNTLEAITNKQKQTSSKFSGFEKLKDFITTKKEEIDLSKLKTDLTNLKNTKEGSEISELLDEYIKHINTIKPESSDKITAVADRFVIPGIYNGFTKIFKTMYQILSMPAAAINGIVNKFAFSKSEKAFNKIEKMSSTTSNAKLKKAYNKEAVNLSHLINKNKKSANANAKIVDQIKKGTRNFETGAETGELANLSRTMVTAISTYFFVNDYANKVLIESAGKDTQKAKEERNERIAHKLSNFVINGTLMNLFNSVFKTPLNNSLISATAIATGTEMLNEALVRKSICQPIGKKDSKQEIIDYENKQINKKGIMGTYSRVFRKITGKKTLTQKAGISDNQDKK